MSDPVDPPADPTGTAAPEPAEEAAGPRTAPARATVDRRRFIRALAGESVTTAGRLAGLSGAMTGAVVAGARAAGESFGALGAPPRSIPPAAPTAPHRANPVPTPGAPGGPGSGAPDPPSVPLRLSDADRVTIEGLCLGLLATNQPGAAPAVGIVRFAWDGSAFRIPGRSATARTANLQRDPFASLTLIDPETGDALLLAGRARLLYGAEGREGATEALTAAGAELTDDWDASDARGDPILVVLEPQRCIRRQASEERP